LPLLSEGLGFVAGRRENGASKTLERTTKLHADQLAAHWYAIAAAEGYAPAQNNLAELYEHGRTTLVDTPCGLSG
jgi:TPR repeat protein